MSDPVAWEPLTRSRTYDQLMLQIERRIRDGELHAGDRLPGERQLAEALGVSRPSLRETLRVLEALGVVEIRRGAEGGAVLRGEASDVLARLLTMQTALGQYGQDDVVGTRLALETWSCAQAASTATDDDHRALTEILDAMDAASTSEEFNRLDAAFHARIARSAGNALTAVIMDSLRVAIEHEMIAAYRRLADWRETVVTVRAEHRAILAAIESRDAGAASRLVHDHIASFYRATAGGLQ